MATKQSKAKEHGFGRSGERHYIRMCVYACMFVYKRKRNNLHVNVELEPFRTVVVPFFFVSIIDRAEACV